MMANWRPKSGELTSRDRLHRLLATVNDGHSILLHVPLTTQIWGTMGVTLALQCI